MFTVELYAKVRYAVMIEGLSRREAAKRFGIHRNTISPDHQDDRWRPKRRRPGAAPLELAGAKQAAGL
jgi:transposase